MSEKVDEILAERRTTHGDYTDHARVTQEIMRAMQNSPNWECLPDIIRETAHMTAHKWARILTGNSYVHEHYVDIMGYTQLVVERTDDKVGLKPEVQMRALQPHVPAETVAENAKVAEMSAQRAENALESVRTLANQMKDSIGVSAAARRIDALSLYRDAKGAGDFYAILAEKWGVTRPEAKMWCILNGFTARDKTTFDMDEDGDNPRRALKVGDKVTGIVPGREGRIVAVSGSKKRKRMKR